MGDTVPLPLSWLVSVGLIALVAAPYALRVSPKTPRDWRDVTITLAFVIWVLMLMLPVRSR